MQAFAAGDDDLPPQPRLPSDLQCVNAYALPGEGSTALQSGRRPWLPWGDGPSMWGCPLPQSGPCASRPAGKASSSECRSESHQERGVPSWTQCFVPERDTTHGLG
eukprot:46265-Chlamydomonas_euryale.AAC.1